MLCECFWDPKPSDSRDFRGRQCQRRRLGLVGTHFGRYTRAYADDIGALKWIRDSMQSKWVSAGESQLVGIESSRIVSSESSVTHFSIYYTIVRMQPAAEIH